jgi:tetratricopeptide (TPR) repeat protein
MNFWQNRLNIFFIAVGLLGISLFIMAGVFIVQRIPAWNDSRAPVDILDEALTKQGEGDTEAAKKLFSIILIKAPKDSPTLYHANRGLMHIALQEERYSAAEGYFVRASKAVVVYFHLFTDISEVYKTGPLKSHQEVFTSNLERIAKQVPNDTNFAVTLAAFYRDTNQSAQAIQWYQFAIDNKATNAALLQAEIDSLKNTAR